MSRLDPHSYVDIDQARTRHIQLRWSVDFKRRSLEGEVLIELDREASGTFDLDTKGLTIHGVRTAGGAAIPYQLGDEEPILGRRLRLDLPAGTRTLTIAYAASPEAVALQWLEPEQTSGKKHPLLFSQCQAIHARTIVPIQDSPSIRMTYAAEVTVPTPLSAVMSAGPAGDRPGPAADTRTFRFEMPQRIPAYLIALAVGNLVSRDLSPRARVWAEPEIVESAAWELAGVEAMIVAAEKLFGPYEWDRYDMLVLPHSFPFGGMENPRMTFLTPTLLAGDRSLVDVVAHELAHSWTGNLVTNASMEHFWLNEGFTVWAERRILEALHGPGQAVLGWAIGEKALEQAIQRFGADSPLMKLRTDLTGIDPDDAFSVIPYEKGARFLALIERTAGRERFDELVRAYIDRFRFTSMTSEQFMEFLEQRFPGMSERVNASAWLTEPGMPANAPVFRSETLDGLTSLAGAWSDGRRPSAGQIAAWKPAERLVYLQHVPRPLSAADCAWLDSAFSLNVCGNYEILVEWLTIAASSDYAPAFDRIREVMARVGRMKYLRPVFTAMRAHPRTRGLARDIFAAAAPSYHALSRRVIESILEKYPAEAAAGA